GAGVSYKSRPRSACVRRWTCVEWSSIGLRATPVSLPCEVDLGRLGQRLRVESSRQLDTRGFDVDRGGELGEHLVELGPAVDEWLLGVGHISPSGCERVLRARKVQHVAELAAAKLAAVHFRPAFIGDDAGGDPGHGGGHRRDGHHSGGRALLHLQLGDTLIGAAPPLSRPCDLNLAWCNAWRWRWLVAVPSRLPRRL